VNVAQQSSACAAAQGLRQPSPPPEWKAVGTGFSECCCRAYAREELVAELEVVLLSDARKAADLVCPEAPETNWACVC
jgi:hypothetical protein